MLRGTVKWFNQTKEFGFIGCDEGPDVFIDYSAIQDENLKSLSSGDKVEFDVVDGPRGPLAVNVLKID